MNNSGIYSVVIAVAALAIIAAASLFELGTVRSENVSTQVAALGAIKSDWTNAAFLLDKATAKAMADSVNTGPCTFAYSAAETEISLEHIAGNVFKDCSLSSLAISNPAGPPVNPSASIVQVTASLRCARNSGAFDAFYEKGIEIKKEISATIVTDNSIAPPTSNCEIKVFDELGNNVLEITRVFPI